MQGPDVAMDRTRVYDIFVTTMRLQWHLMPTVRCALAIIWLALFWGCSVSPDTKLNELSDAYGFQWPTDLHDVRFTSWKYRTALEGMRQTQVSLARAETSKAGLGTFIDSISNRVELLRVPYEPVHHPELYAKAEWWDVHVHKNYQYLEMPLIRNGSQVGHLKVYIVTLGDRHVIYCTSYRR